MKIDALWEQWRDYCNNSLGKPCGRDDEIEVFFDNINNIYKMPNLFRMALYSSYAATDHPTHKAEPELWLRLFRYAGYCLDGIRVNKTADLKPVTTLYRASSAKSKLRLSWTSDIEVAKLFVEIQTNRYKMPDQSLIWQIDCPRKFILGRMGAAGRPESEYIVDYERLPADIVTPHI